MYSDWLKNLQVRLRAIWFAKIVAISNVTSPWIFKIGMCLGYGHRDDAIHVILLLDLLTEPSRFMIFTWIKLLTVTFPTPIEDYPLLQIIIFDDIHYLYYTGPFLHSLKKITIKIILVLYFFMNHATSDMLISLLTNNIENHNNRRLENWRAKIT